MVGGGWGWSLQENNCRSWVTSRACLSYILLLYHLVSWPGPASKLQTFPPLNKFISPSKAWLASKYNRKTCELGATLQALGWLLEDTTWEKDARQWYVSLCSSVNVTIPIMAWKLTIFSGDDKTRQSSVKTEDNVGVGWQTYLSSRRDIIVAAVQTTAGLDSLYQTLRSDNNVIW